MATGWRNLKSENWKLDLTNSPSRTNLAIFFTMEYVWRPDLSLYFRFSIPDEMRSVLKKECGIDERHNTLSLIRIDSLEKSSSNIWEIKALVNVMSELHWRETEGWGKLLRTEEKNKLFSVKIFQWTEGRGCIYLESMQCELKK